MIPEVIDVENYGFRNVGVLNNNNNLVDNKNKGKAIQVDSFAFNNVQSHLPESSHVNLEMFQEYYDPNDPFTQFANQMMEVDDYSMFQDVLDPKNVPAGAEMMVPWGLNASSKGTAKASRSSLSNQATNVNGNPYLATTHVPQPLDFFSGSGLPQNNQPIYSSASFSMVQPQTPDIVMMPTPHLNSYRYDASASSSRPIAAAEVVSSPQDSSNVRKTKQEFLRDFKRFDTVDDFSDHHYASKGKASKQVMINFPLQDCFSLIVLSYSTYCNLKAVLSFILYQHSKNWVKKVQADWMILENDLPGLCIHYADQCLQPICSFKLHYFCKQRQYLSEPVNQEWIF